VERSGTTSPPPQPPPDTTPPVQVGGLSVTTVSSTELNLGWTRNTETDLNHYNVYRGTTPGFVVIPGTTTPVATPATNSYSDTKLTASTTYYYKVAAVDNAGNIGTLSVERSGTTSPPPQPNLYDDFEGAGTYSLTDGQTSPNGKWKSLFAGFGITRISQEGTGNKYIYLEPMTSTSPPETHGSAVATTTSYKNFELSLDVKTIRQLRQNSPPNNWETAWLNWNAIDQFHSYGMTLKMQGFQVEKKDNNNQDDSAEIYLVTQNSPSVKLNTWQKWQITVTGTETGTPRIQIWIDGAKIVDYLDNQPGIPRNSEIMKQGGPIVLYTEDAAVGFDNVVIRPL
jgi:3-keto-disaccharide hydrolase/fibronectin type III domain protein